jgi:hypothetical protein
VRRLPFALGLAVVLGLVLPPSQGSFASDPSSRDKSVHSFLALADRAVSGTFSELYRISTGEASTSGVVAVAQEATSGQRPFVTGPGTWSFLYENEAGYSSQWIEKGSTAWDCWRPPGANVWTCSGPGSFRYVNGFLMAVAPYVPGQFIGESNQLTAAFNFQMPGLKKAAQKVIAAITFSRKRNTHFGLLDCMKADAYTTCLDSSGVVVSQHSGTQTITLLRHSATVPASAFKLQGTTTGGPFLTLPQPYVQS